MTQTTETAIEVAPKSEIAAQLLDRGMNERDVAMIVRMPIHEVQSLRQTTTLLNVADQEIADAMRNLIWVAYEEAMYRIMYGSPTDRMNLIKQLLASGMRLVGVESSTRFDEMRTTFNDMMEDVRQPAELPFIPTDDTDAETYATSEPAYDSD